ncbi:ribose 5-phosphate isomerase [Bacillus coahuilensis m2-6]|uniref:ribose 5-phosphate isomerase A n=1 Tax=Bacillus coahuilensis TaxID=408580 RepID=UPI0007504CD0|nr:ribose 5-phosphate isomerase A [Bacillus coahuilensis]KUP09750.1 ribose 5-phosphate isomerase [Bacillus coahuilensis m2-6]
MMDKKQQCAKKAMDYIKDGMVIGLGGGSTIKHLIGYIARSDKEVKIITPSFETRQHCIEAGLRVLSTSDVGEVSVAFDGCDQVDEQFHALKSGGGIHTEEKLIASMANDYILLVDDSKYVPTLTYDHPVVLEVLPQALAFVKRQLESFSTLGGALRMSKDRDGAVLTENGNYLIDVRFPPQENSRGLEQSLKGLPGVVEVSLFTAVVSKVLVATDNGVREVASRRDRGIV